MIMCASFKEDLVPSVQNGLYIGYAVAHEMCWKNPLEDSAPFKDDRGSSFQFS